MTTTAAGTVERIFSPSHDRPGPTHAEYAGVAGQSWCGVKAQFRHWQRPGTLEQVTCPTCQRAAAAGQPKSWRRR